MPNALLYGISYELFWHLNPAKMRPFKLAYQKKLEQDNYNAWLQGAYIKLAVSSAMMGKKVKYPDKPFGVESKEAATEAANIAAKKFDAWAKLFNEKFEKG